ncbi:ATP-binding protein [Paractinoplanes globisporus]|uniref:ATP-binding protein n=1 Tax=Paractinoplanes globisporus TaxID=113565 RepID=A0ABW6WSR6_9ACTN|nr:helix-turn-helix transcriptional regulator [Actinoplanes globisporus]
MTGWMPPALPEQWERAAEKTFVGRAAELAALEEAWAAAAAGARQLVFVGGEAGAGKSRLAAEAARALHRAGATVLIGGCVAELGEPYQPFVEPLKALLAGVEDAAPRLRVLTGEVPVPDADQAFQRQLCIAVVDLIRTTTRHAPLVLILEDLHWSGTAGQQLLTYIAQHTAADRLLVLATHRDTAPDRSAALVRTIATVQGADGVQRIDLAPLRPEDIADYLMRDAGVRPERARAAAETLHRRTGGNPYFVREVWRDLRARGGLGALDDAWTAPASVRDAFQSRLARLSPEQAAIARLAAVIGEEVEPAILCSAAGSTAAPTLAAVDACVDAGLMLTMADGDDTFRFTHALARQSVLELIPASARMDCHARVAAAIERQPATHRRVQRLAHHYASAHPLGYTGQAVRYLAEAARIAAQGLAHSDAARLYERAAALVPEAEARDAALLNAVEQHIHAADFVRARELAERVAAKGTDAQRLLAAVAFEAASWRPGLPSRQAVQLLREALERARPGPTGADYVRLLAGLGRALSFTGNREQASASMTRALELARAAHDDRLLMEALSASLWDRQTPHYFATVRDRAVELSGLARKHGDLVLLGPAAHHRAMAAYLLGDPNELEAAHRELAGVAQATGQAYFEYHAAGAAYGKQFIVGDFAAAERTCDAQLRLGLSLGPDQTTGPFGVQSFMVRRESGALEQVRPLITGEERPGGYWAPGLLALYTEFGLREPAARLMRWILDRPVLCDEASAQWPMVLAFLVEAALWLGDTATAADLRPALDRYAGLNLVAEPFVALFGSADRYIGAVDSLLGQGDPAASLAAALEMDTRVGAPVHVAQTLTAIIEHRRRTGAGEADVRDLVARARAIAEPLGLRRVLRTLGERDTAARPAGLTDRELQVLRLLGAGLGNREIGARLFITENTAANHVRSILAKTGARNRTQAARYAAQHGLT